jgi:succinoglycan biosynthesis protein ExoA
MPLVSVIVPCYNEQATIRLLLDALYAQTFPRSEIEVVIADGQSTDSTRQEIAAFQHACPDLTVRVIENAKRTIPSGLNQALRAASGKFVVRLDAHSIPYPDYVERCISALESNRGDNVGGRWEIRPGGKKWLARAIAAAASHPLGVGDAHYRLGSTARAVDTVPFGAFRRSLVEEIGLYDESLLTNEDYEFNVRVRASGGTVWLDPDIRSTYFARSALVALARQYWRYGYWKARMLRRYPNTLRWRQMLPPAFVFSLASLVVLSFFTSLSRWLLAVEVGVYLLALLAVGLQVAIKKRDPVMILGIPLSISTMHLAWGSALIWSLVTP